LCITSIPKSYSNRKATLTQRIFANTNFKKLLKFADFLLILKLQVTNSRSVV